MELTWLPDIPQSRSRTRALRACPTCQRSKKRCRHLIPKWEPSNTPDRRSPQLNDDPGRATHRDVLNREQLPASVGTDRARTTSDNPASLSVPATERFVGDLNPESLIRERLQEPTGTPLRDRIGLWINSPAAQKAKPRSIQRGPATAEDCMTNFPAETAINSQDTASLLHQRFTAGMQARERLPLGTRQYLSAIYFSKLNHIVPIVDQGFIQAQAEGLSSVFLEKAICLAAAKTPAANPYLRLVSGGPILSSRRFCSEIYQALVVAMDAELEQDRLTRIRILALMSLHCEGLEGAEAASLHLCQAIHQAQTVGLHLGRPNQTSTDSLTKLFWCLWTLDKMHASIGGRPVLLADRDIGVVKPSVGPQTSRGAFEVWLAISDLLATVISFYRPSADTTSGWEEAFPAFEDIVGENTQDNLDFTTLGFLELYYHSVAILSCRYNPTETIDSTRLSSVRQGLAAIRIHSIVASECTDDLPPLPVVPYSVTLSMGVSYRQLRSSRLITHLDRAKASLEACRSVLENLSPYWYSAEAMARLGQKALHQIQGKPQSSRTNPMGPQHVAEPSHEQVKADNSVPEGPEPINSVSQGNDSPRAKRQRNDGFGIATVSPTPEIAMGALQPSVGDLDTSIQEGFADIDTLFGEFLDISLPTNFWDPIFMDTPGQTNDLQS
ncbi:transcriptional regulator family: Fungal Specific TF [Penicillium coprophilum]|uniref:transcriptional regulator family: Fungal Specific TF n=1 Tax=Penicillium coprophilum TaxID=36646 RepID=UPI0023914673|nr:transcriptional regulator family: Fungal Specific TF [Penicillium coprophilum]KAJ5177499.1 transcriptional regulator family: Fungal Specific TF [Penicillium coprophilum]